MSTIHPSTYLRYANMRDSLPDRPERSWYHPKWHPTEAPHIPNLERANEFVAFRQPVYVATLGKIAALRDREGYRDASLVHTVPISLREEIYGMKAAMLGTMEYFTSNGFDSEWVEGNDSMVGHGGKWNEGGVNPPTVSIFGVTIRWVDLDVLIFEHTA